jgi:hypothetical protein
MSNMGFSESDYQQMQARLAKQNPVKQRTPKAVTRERDLHDDIDEYCRSKGYLVIHARMDRESTIAVGIPDFTIFMPNRAVFIECKARNGKTTTEQLAKIAHARKLGFTAEVVDNFDDAVKAMETL